VFRSLAFRGRGGSLTWGYRTAADLTSWAVNLETTAAGGDGVWKLTATLGRVDKFQIRQRPLLFTAPRIGGRWCWPVLDLQVGESAILAKLGPPEQ
jgi:hypothetical protein